MKKNALPSLLRSLLYLTLFVLWTFAIQTLDVQPIGPNGSSVGFAALNSAFHRLTGIRMNLYIITDWLSLLPVFIMMFFAAVGLSQLIRRRRILKVDADILLLGLFYLTIFGFYLLFEEFPVNYRPVLIDGYLEVSYPSSTTLLVLTVMSSSSLQIRLRIKSLPLRKVLITFIALFSILMVLGRTISGVHWLSDIIGGILLSAGLTGMYNFPVAIFSEQKD